MELKQYFYSRRLTELAQWVDQNNIMANVEKTLDEAGNALDYQNDKHARCKVILAVEG